jgi:hypothetical protein
MLDELASLQRLPQLHTAITENRKSNNPVVLGFQGRSQLEARYGLDAEAMLSQPATKVFLRTSEPKSALWISETIGKVELERIRETMTDGRDKNSRSYSKERQVEHLIMDSQISGLDALQGYIKHGNLVVEFRTRPITREKRAVGFIARNVIPPAPPDAGRGPKPSNGGSPAHELAPAEPHQESILENE